MDRLVPHISSLLNSLQLVYRPFHSFQIAIVKIASDLFEAAEIGCDMFEAAGIGCVMILVALDYQQHSTTSTTQSLLGGLNTCLASSGRHSAGLSPTSMANNVSSKSGMLHQPPLIH